MLIFIDESGDPGMKGKAGTSEYFIVTAVIFEDHEEADKCDAHIERLRGESLHGREFHFNSCSRNLRQRFLAETAKFEYLYFSFAFTKAKL